jgi:hypothetical protein
VNDGNPGDTTLPILDPFEPRPHARHALSVPYRPPRVNENLGNQHGVPILSRLLPFSRRVFRREVQPGEFAEHLPGPAIPHPGRLDLGIIEPQVLLSDLGTPLVADRTNADELGLTVATLAAVPDVVPVRADPQIAAPIVQAVAVDEEPRIDLQGAVPPI